MHRRAPAPLSDVLHVYNWRFTASRQSWTWKELYSRTYSRWCCCSVRQESLMSSLLSTAVEFPLHRPLTMSPVVVTMSVLANASVAFICWQFYPMTIFESRTTSKPLQSHWRLLLLGKQPIASDTAERHGHERVVTISTGIEWRHLLYY